MTGVCFFSFPIIKALLICSEHIDSFWIYRQANKKPQQPAQAMFISLHWHKQTLAYREVSTRAGQRTRKKGMRHFLSSQCSDIPSHKTTSIQRKMTGALLLLNLGVSIPQSCWIRRQPPFLCSAHSPEHKLWLHEPVTANPHLHGTQSTSSSILGHKSLGFQGGFLLPSPITFGSISEIPRQSCPSCRAPSVSLHHMSICILAQLLLLFCFWWHLQSWEIWPFTTIQAATSGAQSGAPEYHGWDFQR